MFTVPISENEGKINASKRNWTQHNAYLIWSVLNLTLDIILQANVSQGMSNDLSGYDAVYNFWGLWVAAMRAPIGLETCHVGLTTCSCPRFALGKLMIKM